MADLGKNSLWGDIKKKAGNIETDIMGPAYSYADHLPPPSGEGGLGVGSDGTFSQLGTNLGAVGTYVSTLVGGTAMGNQYYVNTGGTCTAPDGSIQPRYNYINNESKGLVFGVVNDIGGLNPTYLMNSMMASASPACKCYKCPVSSGKEYNFLSPDLSPDFTGTLCKVVDPSNCMPKSTEGFANDMIIPLVLAGVALTAILILRK
jgi:hypothetical protein